MSNYCRIEVYYLDVSGEGYSEQREQESIMEERPWLRNTYRL